MSGREHERRPPEPGPEVEHAPVSDSEVAAAITAQAGVELERWLAYAAGVDPDRQPEEYHRAWDQVDRWDAIAEGKTVEQLRGEAEAEPEVDVHAERITEVSWAVAARDAAQERGDEVAAAVFGGEAREALVAAVAAGVTPEQLAVELSYPCGADELLGIDAEHVRSLAPAEFDAAPAGVEAPRDIGVELSDRALAAERGPVDGSAVTAAQERAEQAVADARASVATARPPQRHGEPDVDRAAAEDAERSRRDGVERQDGHAREASAEHVREQYPDRDAGGGERDIAPEPSP